MIEISQGHVEVLPPDERIGKSGRILLLSRKKLFFFDKEDYHSISFFEKYGMLVFLSLVHLPGHFNEQYDCVRYGIKALSPRLLIAVPGVTALKLLPAGPGRQRFALSRQRIEPRAQRH